MSDGLKDALRYMMPGVQRVSESGDGENHYTVFPDDDRWTMDERITPLRDLIPELYTSDKKDPWDEDTQEIFLDQYGQPLPGYSYSTPWGSWMQPKPCECGAVKTSSPNLHSHWCPQFKDPMGGI